MEFNNKEEAQTFLSKKQSKLRYYEQSYKIAYEEVDSMRAVIDYYQPVLEEYLKNITGTQSLIEQVKREWNIE